MNPEVIERVLACPRLPSLPAVALRVIELTQKHDVSFGEIAQTITNDQGLSSKVLRTVNSPFYGLRKPCSTINQSIVLLGLSAVKTLALGFSLVSAIQESSKGFDFKDYWMRSLLSGVAAKCIASEAKCGFDEECFLGGLLQDVGMVALMQSLGQEYEAVLSAAGPDHRSLAREEMSAIEVTHADIGAMLTQRWKLPPELVMPVKYHERPTAAPKEHLSICQSVGLGNIAADVVTAAEPGVPLRRFYAKAQDWFALSPAQCDSIIRNVAAGAKDMGRLLSLDVGPAVDGDKLLARANEELRQISLPFDPGHMAQTGDEAASDPKTGLPSRMIFNRNLIAGFEQSRSGDPAFSIALLALDDLEQLRTRQGDQIADALLLSVAASLQRHFDTHTGLVCRFADNCFGVILAKLDRQAATRCVEAARGALSQGGVTIKPPGLKESTMAVTLSGGLVSLDPTTAGKFDDVEAFIRVAESALQAAGRAGNNTLRVYSPRVAA